MNRKIVISLILAVIILFTLVQFLCACLSSVVMCAEGQEPVIEYYKSNWFCLFDCSKSSCVPVG